MSIHRCQRHITPGGSDQKHARRLELFRLIFFVLFFGMAVGAAMGRWSVTFPTMASTTSSSRRCSLRSLREPQPCVAALLSFAWLPYYPVWAILFIAISIAVIWALTVHGRDIAVA